MRVIAGTKKGMKLFSPKGDVSRPIVDRVKESLFSVLYKYDLPAGAVAADLFCGVGSLGIEALSRGAEFVTFVEKDRQTAAVLERNLQKAGFIKESKVITANAWSIAVPLVQGKKCALVFVDPPYADTANVAGDSALGGLLELLQNQLTNSGIVVVRTNKDTKLLASYGEFDLIEKRIWGTMAIGFLGLRKK